MEPKKFSTLTLQKS